MVKSAEERRDFWIMLRGLAGTNATRGMSDEQLKSRIRQEVVEKISAGLMGLVSGDQSLDLTAVRRTSEAVAAGSDEPASGLAAAPAAAAGDYMAPWIESEECTACDECLIINPQIFAYDDDKKAYIQSAEAGPYRDLVKSAEKCTAQVVHPGLPRNRSEKDINKWIERGQKFN